MIWILDVGGCIIGKVVCESLCSSGGSFIFVIGFVFYFLDDMKMIGGLFLGCGVLVR